MREDVAVDIDAALAETVAQSLAVRQYRSLAIAADVGSIPDIQRMVDRTIADCGHIPHLEIPDRFLAEFLPFLAG